MSAIAIPINSESITRVVIRPSVILSVMEHSQRMAKLTTCKRVGGILLGAKHSENVVDITNCFVVQFNENKDDPDAWTVDYEHVEKTRRLLGMPVDGEDVVGWYHTGDNIHLNDIIVNEQIRQMYCPFSVLIIFDVQSMDLGVNVESFIACDHLINEKIVTTFEPIISECETENVREEDQPFLVSNNTKDFINKNLTEDLANQLQDLKQAAAHILNIRKYLRSVRDSHLPINQQILKVIQQIVLALPEISPAEITNAADKGATQQILLECTSIVKSILAIHLIIGKSRIETHPDPVAMPPGEDLADGVRDDLPHGNAGLDFDDDHVEKHDPIDGEKAELARAEERAFKWAMEKAIENSKILANEKAKERTNVRATENANDLALQEAIELAIKNAKAIADEKANEEAFARAIDEAILLSNFTETPAEPGHDNDGNADTDANAMAAGVDAATQSEAVVEPELDVNESKETPEKEKAE